MLSTMRLGAALMMTAGLNSSSPTPSLSTMAPLGIVAWFFCSISATVFLLCTFVRCLTHVAVRGW